MDIDQSCQIANADSSLVPLMSPSLIASMVPVMRELSDLKRIYSSGRDGSIATRLFVDGWKRLLNEPSIEKTMEIICAQALAACRLGDLDRLKLLELGMSVTSTDEVLKRSFDAISEIIHPTLANRFRSALSETEISGVQLPDFCHQLAKQPRAGITCPDRARVMLLPTENHADHCLVVAVIGALLAPVYGADASKVFLAGMSHHLYNAVMPDSGFTGEVLLGNELDSVISAATEYALASVPDMLSDRIRHVLADIKSDQTSVARAFHAADVLDRVLEIEQHLTGQKLSMLKILEEYKLVHGGPIKVFHDTVLVEAGLA